MCEKLMKYSDIFKAHFLENMLPLADDKVPNVRISLAKALQKAFNKQSISWIIGIKLILVKKGKYVMTLK